MKKKSWGEPLSKIEAHRDLESFLQISFRRRVLLAGVLVLAGMAALVARMFHLQVTEHRDLSTRAQENRIRFMPLVPERGTIYDAKGRPLTQNILRYQVMVNPSEVNDLKSLLAQIADVLPLSEAEISDFMKRYRASRRYQNVMLKDSITEEEHYRLAVRLYQFPGVKIASYYERYYPQGALTAHIIGYINRISAEDLQTINAEDYHGINYIGRSGIERQYEAYLRGKPGYQQVETDANGNLVRVLEELPAQRGQDIYLTLDLDLQRYMDELLAEHQGSSVAINTETGGILGMVSKPGYDPNLFARGISQAQYDALLHNPNDPLYDRAVRGNYPPGSVIKPAMYLAGLFHHVVTPQSVVFCPGYFVIPNSDSTHRFRCWKHSGHGALSGAQAIAQSCDVYFYTLGYRLGIDRMGSYLQNLSIGQKTGVDLPDEDAAIMPSRAWKQQRFKTNWYIGDTVNVSIGQGYMTVTPLQLAHMTALIARDGQTFTPHLLSQRYDALAGKFIPYQAPPAARVANYVAADWQEVRHAMHLVMTSAHGTGRRAAHGAPYQMAGKSGTAQVITYRREQDGSHQRLRKEENDNAMFIAFAPFEAPKVAVSVVIERGGEGGAVSGPIARKITDFCLLGGQDTGNA